ncbi:MAG: cellulose binding domain-containing protein [Kineosporiaceae bacterium]
MSADVPKRTTDVSESTREITSGPPTPVAGTETVVAWSGDADRPGETDRTDRTDRDGETDRTGETGGAGAAGGPGGGDVAGAAPERQLARRHRSGRGDSTGRRRIPWGWVVVGVIALFLVGNGIVAAGRDSDPGTEGTTVTAATSVPSGTVSSATVTTTPTVTMTPTATLPSQLPKHVVLPRATTSTTPSTTTSSPTTTTSTPTLTCRASAHADNYWPNGYNTTITAVNTGDGDLDGWTVGFTLPPGQRIVHVWGASTDSSHGFVQARDGGYNAALPAGGSVSFGIQVSTDHAVPGLPSGFSLNGVGCS